MTPQNPPDDFDALLDMLSGQSGGALTELDQLRMGSARGRQAVEAENIQANIDKLRGMLDTVSPAQRPRIQRLIKSLEDQLGGWTRPVTQGRSAAGNFARGVASGVVTTPVAAADLALAIPDLLLPEAAGGALAGRARSALQENMAINREVIDPQGAAGLTGEVASSLAAGALPYGAAARGSALAISKVAPGLRPLLAGGAEAGRLRGAAGNVVAGLPLNILQAASMPDATAEQAATTGLIGIGADAIFGALMPGSQLPNQPRRAAARTNEDILRADAEVAAMTAAANAKKAEEAKRKAVRREATTAWKRAHPEGNWNTLSKAEKDAWIAQYATNRPQQPDAPPPVAEPSAPVQATPEQLATLRREVARAEADAAAAPDDPVAREALEALRSMQQRVDPNATAEGSTNPIVQTVVRKQQVMKELKERKIPFSNTEPLSALEKRLSEAQARPQTVEAAATQASEIQRQLAEEAAHPTPNIAKIKELSEQLASLKAAEDQMRAGVVEPPPAASGSVVGQMDATTGPSAGSPATNPSGITAIKEAPSNILLEELEAVSRDNPHETDRNFLAMIASERLFQRGKTLKEVNALLKKNGFTDQWLVYPEGVTPPKGQEHLAYKSVENRILGPAPSEVVDVNSNEYIGRTLAEDLLNPTEIGPDGRPTVLLPKGHVLTSEDIQRVTQWFGLETVSLEPITPKGAQGRVAGSIGGAAEPIKVIKTEDGWGYNGWAGGTPREALWSAAMNGDAPMSADDAFSKPYRFVDEWTGEEIPEAPAGGTTQPSPATPSATAKPAGTAPEPTTTPSAQPAVKRKYAQLTEGKLDKLEDDVTDQLDNLNPDSAEYKTAIETLQAIAEERKLRRATGEMAPVDAPIQQEVKIKKGPNFDTEGTYVAVAGDQQIQFFRDAERRMWYKINDGAKGGPDDPLFSYIGSTKQEAIDWIKNRFNKGADTPLPVEAPPKAKKIKPVASDKIDTNSALDSLAKEAANVPIPKFNTELLTRDIKSLNDTQLSQVIEHYNTKLSEAPDPARADFLRTKYNRALAEQARRQTPPSTGPDNAPKVGDGLRVQSNPVVGAFATGLGYGWYMGDENDPDRLNKAFMWGLATATGFGAGRYLLARHRAMAAPKRSDLLQVRGGEGGVPKRVIDAEELGPKSLFLTALRHMYDGEWRQGARELKGSIYNTRDKAYSGVIRGTYALDNLMSSVGRRSLAAQINPAKLASMFGRYIARTERFVTSNGRLTYEDTTTGEPVVITNAVMAQHGLPVDPETGDAPRGLAYILGMAEGDKDALGQLAVAYASIEGSWRGSTPMSVEEASAIIRGAHPKLRVAVKELRKYNMALMLAAHKAGRLSLQGLQMMATEDWYTPFQRVAQNLEELARRTKKNTIAQPDPVKGRKGGSKLPVLNPYDATVEMTRRVLRANEYGQILNALVDQVQSLPLSIRASILEPVSKNTSAKIGAIESAVEQLRRTARLSESDARSMLAYINDDLIYNEGARDSILHVFRDGTLQAFRLKRPDLFEALKALQPTEIDMMYRLLGLPARVAAKGTVYNPVFIARMTMIDSFQAWLGSKYGFRPGIDQLRGFLHAALRTEKYQNLLDVGGPATLQSLSYIDPKTAEVAARTGGGSAIETAVRNVKEMQFVEAYKALILPLAESARVGEYLRALDHGASTIEAAYAAWDVVGNPRMQGSFASVRAFHQMTLFSRPALSAIDKLVTEMGIGLVEPEYNKTATGRVMQRLDVAPRAAAAMTIMAKGFAGITIPTAMLWYINKDDEEIRKLRQTKTGQLYWFFRLPTTQEIVKIRKPHIIGQIFGSSFEAFADNEVKKDPQNLYRVLGSMVDDASVNTLPQLGVITYGLWANKTPGLDSPITRSSEESLAPELRGYDKASLPARIVAEQLGDVADNVSSATLRRAMSPAGIDYITRSLTGMLGEDAMQIVGAAVEYTHSGMPPSADEAPLIARFVARYPSMNVQPIREFYRRDRKVEEAARTLAWLQQHRPEAIADYWTENAEWLVQAENHRKTRMTIAAYRRAIEDIKVMPREYADKATRRRVEQEFLKAIEASVLATNSAAEVLSQRRR